MTIKPAKYSELAAMLGGRPDLIQSGFDIDDALYASLRAEQDRAHPDMTDEWKDAHAAYAAYFQSQPKGAPQIDLDPAKTPEEVETKVFRALNAFLADSSETRKAIVGAVSSMSESISGVVNRIRTDLAACDLQERKEKTAALSAIETHLNRCNDSIAANQAALEVQVATVIDKIRQVGTANEGCFTATRERIIGAIDTARNINCNQHEGTRHSISILTGVLIEEGEKTRDCLERITISLDHNTRHHRFIAWLQFAAVLTLILLFATRGNAQSSVVQGMGSPGTTKGGVLTVQGSANGSALPVTQAISTAADGALSCYITSAASTNSTNCKSSAGNIYGIYIINTTATNYFLRMYNASSAPTCSSATGFVETVVALGASTNGGGISRPQAPQAYSTGIGFCLTGGGGSTDNTNAATGVYVLILYK